MATLESGRSLDQSPSVLKAGLLSQRAAWPRRLGIVLLTVLYCWQEPLQASFSDAEGLLGMHPAPGPHTSLFGGIFVWYLLANTGLVGQGAPHVWRSGYRGSAVLIALCGFAGIFMWYWGADLAARWGALYLPLRIANGLFLVGALLRVYWRGPAFPIPQRGFVDAEVKE